MPAGTMIPSKKASADDDVDGTCTLIRVKPMEDDDVKNDSKADANAENEGEEADEIQLEFILSVTGNSNWGKKGFLLDLKKNTGKHLLTNHQN